MSSEEETYSDQSIMIFYNNFIGIREAVAPFIATLGNSSASSEGEGAHAAATAWSECCSSICRIILVTCACLHWEMNSSICYVIHY